VTTALEWIATGALVVGAIVVVVFLCSRPR